MDMLNEKMVLILRKLDDIDSRLCRIEASCTGMDSHIGFVESVYETVKSPLDYITNQINKMMRSGHATLPNIDNQQLTQ